jgi:predicted phage tail component-like protein
MNEIIWKGVSSTKIEGLLICELPPITKPQMRTKTTTIDGMDGSIIDDLGYAAYKKDIVIGLRGGFDIDQVIKYFTGEGDLVLSNEPDKVYRARISGQIDFNRLVRFRQATIKFDVQPFKHKYLEDYVMVTNGGKVFNEGLEVSKPKMVLHGSGTVGISVNGIHIFDYTFPDVETEVVIDSEKQDAFLGDALKNRHMNGEFPGLVPGWNTIEWSGDVESIEILPRSRWL